MTTTKGIFRASLLLAGIGTAFAVPETAQQVDYAATTAAALEQVVVTNKDVNDGEVLAAQQTIIVQHPGDNTSTDDHKIEIHDTGAIRIGDEATTGVLHITRAENAAGDATASLTKASVSVTNNNGGTNVHIGSANKPASMTNVALDLGGLKSDVTFVVEDVTISSSQINQTTGSIHLVNYAGISLIAPSRLHNLHVDGTSSFYGSVVSTEVRVDGDNTVEFTPLSTGFGVERSPLPSGQTTATYQLYGLTFDFDATLELDLSHVHVETQLLEEEGWFEIYMYGVRWMPLEENGTNPITDLDLLAKSFQLTNFGTANGEDISDRLVISKGYYADGSQGLQLRVQVLPETQNVPEPTTATLSLLALAGLAARRRRK